MAFLFPLFLIAGLSLAIPIIIHLLQLRKFKKINFSDTRLLKEVAVNAKKSAKIKNWWLLISRLLLLSCLVLAFAQPIKHAFTGKKDNAIKVLYLDNSLSMTLKNGASPTNWQQIQRQAIDMLNAFPTNTPVIVLSNDQMSPSLPNTSIQAIQTINQLKPVGDAASIKDIQNAITAIQGNNPNTQIDLSIFSDLQKSTFLKNINNDMPKINEVTIYKTNISKAINWFIDTAFFVDGLPQNGTPSQLAFTLKNSQDTFDGTAKNISINITNNQKPLSVKQINITDKKSLSDSITLNIGDQWQQYAFIVNNKEHASFVDTFRMAVKAMPKPTVLIISDEPIDVYLSAALRNNFNIDSKSSNNEPKDWSAYSLIILQNSNTIAPNLANALTTATNNGQNVLITIGTNAQINQLNNFLSKWAGCTIIAKDTSSQTVSNINLNHPLLKGVLASRSKQIALPTTLLHYQINAGSRNGGVVMSFRDGSPYLLEAIAGKGKVYVLPAPLNSLVNNFALNNLFAPLLYKMAIQGVHGNINAFTLGTNQFEVLPVDITQQSNYYSIIGNNVNAVPPQHITTGGMAIMPGAEKIPAGFYQLKRPNTNDNYWIALNNPTDEAITIPATQNEVETAFKPNKINWQTVTSSVHNQQNGNNNDASYPLWKYLIWAGIAWLGVETWLMFKSKKPSAS